MIQNELKRNGKVRNDQGERNKELISIESVSLVKYGTRMQVG